MKFFEPLEKVDMNNEELKLDFDNIKLNKVISNGG